MDRLEKLRAQKDLMRIAELNRKSEFIDEWKTAEDMRHFSPEEKLTPTQDNSGYIDGLIPERTSLGNRAKTINRVFLPAVMDTFETPEDFREATDMGLQDQIMNSDGYLPLVGAPKGNRKPVQEQLYPKKRS